MKTLEQIKKELEERHLYTDKETSYLTNYEEFFTPHRNEPINFLEIGIFQGASLLLWAEYFPFGKIYGIDTRNEISTEFYAYAMEYQLSHRIFPVLNMATPDITVSLENRQELFRQCLYDMQFDIILDDGAHTYTHTKGSFDVLFHDYLKPGGIYIIEDWGTTYFPSWSDGSESGEYGMARIIKELYDEVALLDRLKGQGVKNLSQHRSQIHSVTIRFGQIWIFKSSV